MIQAGHVHSRLYETPVPGWILGENGPWPTDTLLAGSDQYVLCTQLAAVSADLGPYLADILGSPSGAADVKQGMAIHHVHDAHREDIPGATTLAGTTDSRLMDVG